MNEGARAEGETAGGLISLIGLPGVGKSTIGRKLARRLNCGFVDCDALLEERLHCRIRDFFEMEGEQRFREIESALLHELVEQKDSVIATGGGIVLKPVNRDLLRSRTLCIHLSADLDALVQRLRRDTKRPLLQGGDPEARLRALNDERDPLYRETASIVVETHRQPLDALVGAIVERLPHGWPGSAAPARAPH